MDYRALGLKCGLEVHQQLATHKLFCECASRLEEEGGPTFLRRLRPTQSELGEVDAAAVEEARRAISEVTADGLSASFLNSAGRMFRLSFDTLLNGSVGMVAVSREVETGTTTLGLVCKDGVVLAADRRATAGTLIAHKRTKKVYKLDDNLGITTAGLVGDLQVLVRYITAEVELYKLKRGVAMPVEAAATLMANILSGSRFYPYWVQLVIGGWDRSGSHVYSLDAAGGSLPDKFVSSGSGSPYVYGVLEDHWKDDMTLDEGANLAIRAVTAAMKRDAVSGEGIDVALISKDGFKTFDDKEVEKRKASMKLA